MAETTPINCASACTVTVVHELALPPLQLEPEQGVQIAGAILMVWAAGWAIRMLIRAVGTGDEKPDAD